MKALKNKFQNYVDSIVNAINNYEVVENKSNKELMSLYFEIGKNISEQGETAFVIYLSKFLSASFPKLKGFSPRNLRRMRDFYNTYKSDEILMEKAQNLNWTQNTTIMEYCENNTERAFYIDLALKESLSKLNLISAIKNRLFESAFEDEQSKNTSKNKAFCDDINMQWHNDSNTKPKSVCGAFVPLCERYKRYISNYKIKISFGRIIKLNVMHIITKLIRKGDSMQSYCKSICPNIYTYYQ